MFTRLRTIGYSAQNLTKAKEWYTAVLGKEPYFDEPFYVGFDVNGYEIGLMPDIPAAGEAGPITYWSVPDIQAAWKRLLELGARPHEEIQDVGGGTLVASVQDPFGNLVGIIWEPAAPDPAHH